MPNSITNRQMVFILFTTLTTITSVSIAQAMALGAGTGAWIPILLVSVVFGLVAVLIVKLNMLFPGKVLFDYSGELVGKRVAYVIAVFYILYFLVVSTYLCISFSRTIAHNFLPQTPQWAELAVGIPIFGYIAYKGITNLARLFEVIGLILLLVMVLLYIFMLLQGHINNILPLFDPSDVPEYASSAKDLVVPFLGMEILTVIPFTAANRKASKVAFITLIGIGVYYVLVVYACFVMITPEEIVYYKDPLIESMHLVELRPIQFLNRVDIIYLTIGLAGVIAGKSIVITAVVEYTARIFTKAKRLFIVVGVCIAVFVLSLSFAHMKDFDPLFVGVISWGGLPAAVLIPLVLFIVAKVKKHGGKMG